MRLTVGFELMGRLWYGNSESEGHYSQFRFEGISRKLKFLCKIRLGSFFWLKKWNSIKILVHSLFSVTITLMYVKCSTTSSSYHIENRISINLLMFLKCFIYFSHFLLHFTCYFSAVLFKSQEINISLNVLPLYESCHPLYLPEAVPIIFAVF